MNKITLKEFFNNHPDLYDYLANENYLQFSAKLLEYLSYSNISLIDALGELTRKLYDADILDDIIETIEAIPTWCDFRYFDYYEIPEGVETISSYAFQSCPVKTVKIPKTVKYINIGAFRDCQYLESIDLPKSVEIIDRQAFKACNSLKSIKIPEGVTKIGNEAFSHCTSLETISIPFSIRYIGIGENAFNYCPSLTDIYFDTEPIYDKKDLDYFGISPLVKVHFMR